MRKMLAFLLSSFILLFAGCSSGDSWPETLYLDRLFVGGSEVSAAPASPFNNIFKSADETVNNSTDWQDDNEIQSIELEANTSYTIDLLLTYTSSATADFKYRLQFYDDAFTGVKVTGQVIYSNISSLAVTTASYIYGSNIYFTMPATGGNGANLMSTQLRILVSTPSVPITLKLEWAQNTLEASNTVLKSGSFIEWREIN